MTIRNLESMFAPRSVVLVGASAKQGSVGNWLARNLSQGFAGQLSFVNPKGGIIESRDCHRSLADIEAPADLAVVVTPAETVPGIIGELGAAGTKAAVTRPGPPV